MPAIDTPEALLATYAPVAGLAPTIAPWSRTGSLRERLEAHPFLMAPMAGVTDSAWRLMARAGGAALAYTEMVSVAGIHFGGEKTWELVIPHAPEPDIAVQLFGSSPEQFREAAEAVARRLGAQLALIDVNMACPVPKVVRKGEGSALMDDPARAMEAIRACREGVAAAAEVTGEKPVPVTCKIRRGFKTGRELAPVFAEAMEQAGAEAVAVHGRFADQLYRGEADWSVISRVRALTSIPVIASGDISTPEAAVQVMADTGATAVMVARGSYGNPWIFSDAATLLADTLNQAPFTGPAASSHSIRIGLKRSPIRWNGKTQPAPGLREHPLPQRLAAFRLHVQLMGAVGTHIARARSLGGWYLRGIPDAARWRDQAMRCTTVADFLTLADQVESTLNS